MTSEAVRNGYSPDNSPTNPFLKEWALMFGGNITMEEIRKHCIEGNLRDSRLRSVIWRVLLRVLPLDRQEWVTILRNSRKNYDATKARLNINPRLFNDENEDPNHNNPLSLQDENPWQKYFMDEELRECIRKDVNRTFPDLHFFQSAQTRQIMSDILFVYSKLNPHISYRQGMHELLAVIIFVVYFDHRSFEHLSEQGCLENFSDLEVFSVLNNQKYLEHDSYSIFQQLIMLLEGWFVSDSEFSSSLPTEEAEPFSRDNAPNSELLRRLDYINEELLSKVDPFLYRHFKSLDIPVYLFGIRWLRLLFTREFHFNDLLFVWDVILSDYPLLNMVDYVFLALMVQIRDLLLYSDYSAALQYLMRYPPIADTHAFVKTVLHLKFPKIYPEPKNCSLSLYHHLTLAGTAHPNQNKELQRPVNDTAKKPTFRSTKPIDILLNKLGRGALAASPPSDFSIDTAFDKQPPGRQIRPHSTFYVPVETADAGSRSSQLQSHIIDLQNRTKRAIQRLLRVVEMLEQQQNLPKQSQLISELCDISALLKSGLIEEAEVATEEPPLVKLPSRSNSVNKKPDELRKVVPGNDHSYEMIEMHFGSRKKNY